MKVLTLCEYSGIVRNAFTAKGHNATSCDILPTESPGQHIQADALEVLYSEPWDLVIAFPPCTYLCKAQAFRIASEHGRAFKQELAITFFKHILQSSAKMIAIENPVGVLSQAVRPPDQIVRPWWFGSPYDKEICLWLKNLPPLIATCYSVLRRSRANHVNSRMSQDQKSKIKSLFFPEVATAMADQWTSLDQNDLQNSRMSKIQASQMLTSE